VTEENLCDNLAIGCTESDFK